MRHFSGIRANNWTKYKDTMQSGLFESSLTDVTGKIRLESEDPRWMQLFSSKSIDSIVEGFNVSWYGNRLVEHNLSTGNLVQLLRQTSSRIQQVLSRKVSPPGQVIEQCCAALHLSTVIFHFIITTLSPQALRKQLQLPESWPEAQDPHFIKHGLSNNTSVPESTPKDFAVEELVMELALVIDSPQEHTWLRDVRFFSANLLLVMCSTQLYAHHTKRDIRSDGTVSGLSFNGDADLFLNYLFSRAEGQLRTALSGGSGQASSSSAFSSCLAVQLVRGLVIGSTAAEQAQVKGTTTAPAVAGTVLLQKLTATLGAQSTLTSNSSSNNRSKSASAASSAGVVTLTGLRGFTTGSTGLSGTVSTLLWDIFLYLPMSALQRFFRPSATSASPLDGNSNSRIGSPSSAAASSPSSSGHPHSTHTAAEFVDSAELAYHRTRVAGASELSGGGGDSGGGSDGGDLSLLPVPRLVPNAQSLPTDPLPTRCADLLLVLLHNRRSPSPRRPNPFREAFCLLHDLTVHSPYNSAGDGEEGNYSEADLEGGGGPHCPQQQQQQQQLMQGQGGRASVLSASSAFMINASRIHVSMRQVIAGVARNLPGESANLLLYSLLQGHPTFTEMLIRTDSVGLVLSSCLHGLYTLTVKPEKGIAQCNVKNSTSSKNLNQLYVLVVCVLMMVQDSAVLQGILANNREVSMDWYKERQLKHASLLDATLLCLLRTVMHALFRLQDQYLLSNACAALHNLSTRMQSTVLPYTAERLVRVSCQLCSRAVKLHDNSIKNASSVNSRDEMEAQLLPEALGALLQLMDTALRPERVVHNVHLLYALMHDSHTIELLFVHPAVSAALQSQDLSASLGHCVLETVQHYLALLETKVGANNDSPLTAAQTVEWLSAEMANGKKHVHSHSFASAVSAAPGSSKRRYTYQEAESPEEFFLPCIWAAALRCAPEVPWQLLQLTLFDPLAADFIYLDTSHMADSAVSDVAAASSTDDNYSVANSVDLV